MKKRLWLPLVVLTIFVVGLSACQTDITKTITTAETITSTVTATVTAPPMPDDFYIIYESSIGALLDTNKSIVGATLSDFQRVSANHYIPREELQAIYDVVIDYGIKSYCGRGILIDENSQVLSPTIIYTFTFYSDNNTPTVRSRDGVVPESALALIKPLNAVGIDRTTIEAHITNQGKADSGQNNLKLF